MADAAAGLIGWERALLAAEKVKERLRRATKALDDASVPYAVAGGNAVRGHDISVAGYRGERAPQAGGIGSPNVCGPVCATSLDR